jgi:hypothetical protein
MQCSKDWGREWGDGAYLIAGDEVDFQPHCEVAGLDRSSRFGSSRSHDCYARPTLLRETLWADFAWILFWSSRLGSQIGGEFWRQFFFFYIPAFINFCYVPASASAPRVSGCVCVSRCHS